MSVWPETFNIKEFLTNLFLLFFVFFYFLGSAGRAEPFNIYLFWGVGGKGGAPEAVILTAWTESEELNPYLTVGPDGLKWIWRA